MRSLLQKKIRKIGKNPLFIGIIIVLILIFNIFIISDGSISQKYSESDTSNINNRSIKNSDYWNLSPISINGSAGGVGAQNWTWALNEGWCTGNGTFNNPYKIENITVDGGGMYKPLYICDSDKYFIIRNCTLRGALFIADHYYWVGGITLDNVTNGIIDNNNCSNNYGGGIILKNSENCTIKQNIINNNFKYGISLHNSKNCSIYENSAYTNDIGGIELYFSNNTIIEKNIVHNDESVYAGINLYSCIDIDIISNNITDMGGPYNTGILGLTKDSYIFKNNVSNMEDGIEVGGYNNIIKKNNIYNCSKTGLSVVDYYFTWILTEDPINNTFIDNHIEMTPDGIRISPDSNNAIVRNNDIYNSNSIGIKDTGNNSTIFNNTIISSKYGISIEGHPLYEDYNANNGNYSGNFIEICEFGIKDNGNNSIVINNTILSCNYGLSIEEIADNCNYSNNSIEKCNIGIYLSGNGESHSIQYNELEMCGIVLNPKEPLSELTSYHIESSNKVNGKSIYYYCNTSNLDTINFTSYGVPGQIILINCDDSNISNFIITESSYSVLLFYSKNIILNNNNVINNTFSSFYLYNTSNCNIIDNDISSNNGNGVIVDSCFNILIKDNLIQNNNINGIDLKNSKLIEIENNNVNTNLFHGLNLSISEDITIKDNSIIRNINNGISINSLQIIRIEKNIILYNQIDGIKIIDSIEIEISNNTISNNYQYSIFLDSNIFDLTINSNSISFSYNGIYMGDCWNSIVYNNSIFKNTIGITILVSSLYNEIYNNKFFNNDVHAIDSGFFNLWYKETIGNYWDDYKGVDKNGDGIGDSPYNISGRAESQDLYPILDQSDDVPLHDDILTIILRFLLSPFSLVIIANIIISSILLLIVNRKNYFSDTFLGKTGSNFIFQSNNQLLKNFINSDKLLEFTPAIQDFLVSSLSPEELKKIDQLNLPIDEINQFIEELTNLNSKERKEILSEMLKSQKED